MGEEENGGVERAEGYELGEGREECIDGRENGRGEYGRERKER